MMMVDRLREAEQILQYPVDARCVQQVPATDAGTGTGQGKGTPGMSLLLLLGALGVAAVVVRRRHA